MTAQVYDFGNTLGDGFEGMFDEGRGYQLAVLQFSDVKVSEQVRKEMEDESSTGEEMSGSIKRHGYLQTMLVRPIPGPIPYELVAGERRMIFGSKAGETEGPFLIKEMTDEEKDDIQFAENIHRKNLTQIEEAKKLQKDLEAAGGDVEAVMAKHNKGRSWVSKVLGLLTLPEQAKRLVTEQVSADMEVIGMVKTIEKRDPEAAKELVDELKATRGKKDARDVAAKVKNQVKPAKPKAGDKAGDKATPRDEAHKEPGPISQLSFAEAKQEHGGGDVAWPTPTASTADAEESDPAPVFSPSTLDATYGLVFEHGSNPKMILDTLSEQERTDMHAWLESFYDAGRQAKNVAQGVMQGLRNGTFATEGAGAYAMLAFIQGSDAEVKRFNLLDVLGLAKA